MEFKVAKLTGAGAQGLSGWTQVHEFRPQDSKKRRDGGCLVSIISIGDIEGGIEAISLGREVLARLHEEYYGKIGRESSFRLLTNAVGRVHKEFSGKWGSVEIVAAVILEKSVNFAAVGGASVVLSRDGNIVNIISSSEEVQNSSGYWRDGDLFLLGTSSFYSKVAKGVLRVVLEKQDATTCVEDLLPLFHAESGSGKVGAAAIEVHKTVNEAIDKQEPSDALVSQSGVVLSESLAVKVAGFLENIEKVLRSLLPEKKVYVEGYQAGLPGTRRRVASLVGVLLLVLLVISIIFGYQRNKQRLYRQSYESDVAEIKHNLEEARQLASLDPLRSRDLLRGAQEQLDSVRGRGVQDPVLDELAGSISNSFQEFLHEYNEDSQLFLDLGLLREGFSADLVSASGGNIVVADKSTKKIITVNLETKKATVVGGSSSGDLEAIALYDRDVFFASGDGIWQVSESNTKIFDKYWGSGVLLYAYSGNLYLVDKQNGEIWRHSGLEGNFDSQRSWLAPGIEGNFEDAVSLAIDGSIWVLHGDGVLEKYVLGVPQQFSLSGEPLVLNQANDVYTDEEQEFLYLLDNNLGRVVVFDKTGMYKSQYVNSDLKNASGIVVSEKLGMIVFASGSHLRYLEIKSN